ncbi:MAG TPA: hypothetical protein VN782_17575 [Usitatibacter sp.]|nr:hypothetical protein [Usitatibacter sp.]
MKSSAWWLITTLSLTTTRDEMRLRRAGEVGVEAYAERDLKGRGAVHLPAGDRQGVVYHL